jgi:pSer/pThr/pTyr-binding forkhead associated (FHA) protein
MTAILDLLDPQQGLPLQTWRLEPGQAWNIGRSDEADIVISSPFVSRQHARLVEQDGSWELIGIWDKGVVVDGEKKSSQVLADGMEFRLVAKGPLLRFRLAESQSTERGGLGAATISFDAETMPLLIVDRTERDKEVDSIAQGDYFQDVKRIAEQMRRKRLKRRDGG